MNGEKKYATIKSPGRIFYTSIGKHLCDRKIKDVKHISKVLRCKVGEKLEICDKDNSEYICEITDINKTYME